MRSQRPSANSTTACAAAAAPGRDGAGRAAQVIGRQPAGPGSRSYAFVIDWHIRVLAALGWMLAAVLALQPAWSLRSGPAWIATAPALAIYFLYHPVVEILLRGQTPGKRKAGVRIVARDGSEPDLRAILIRNALRPIDSLPLFYAVGLVCCVVTAERVRIGDLAAGTLLVEAAPRAAEDARDARDLAERFLQRWASLDPVKRGEIGRLLLARLAGEPAEAVRRFDGEELRRRLRASLHRR
ncbi:MAG TPA: RDD family protein [Steroidobacteraceae bacterium]|nr:RDD family protein [Steroidobacteraceae bacterium]